ncbi:MAG TPA: response regulator transcription factor [Gaiellaceae bacterium]|jgi:DNA-binding NarL/FixJ family response regulator|nr:response regulator transcription factor [Gaiellaceae bacterium]
MPVRVLVVDDERLFVEALELILGTDGRLEVVGHALDGQKAVAMARELDPDVVLIDLSMPGVDGFDAIQAMLVDEPERRIVVLSGSADPDDIANAREAGARDYLLKDEIAGNLSERVIEVGTR